ncbi:MAG: glycosyltransferase family 2 protein [Chloroflexi bacterium]|nr:glycosyltransferase family 2 protein [Chloroflexota bacterium]
MDLSILIVSWNTRELLESCLESIERSWPAGDLQAEVIVVDNGSSDNSAELVQTRFPAARLIVNRENVGFARANNQGLALSQGRYVLLLNSDTVVHAGALETLHRFMEQRPQAGACGPRLLNADGSLQSSCYPVLTPGRELWRLAFLDRLWRRATYAQERWNTTVPRQVEVIKGACLLLRKAALDQVGLLDERYFMYSEEMDLCYRLALAGWEMWWAPQAVVTHVGEASSRQMATAMYVQLYRSKVAFHRKFGGPAQAERFKRLLWLLYLPRLAFAAVAGQRSPSMRQRAQTYRQLLAELKGM